MDYKYIEQLLERYWLCETTLEEEKILRTFFSQENVPVSLLPYKDLFTYEVADVATNRLGEDFDRKMLELTGESTVKARTISLNQRLRPLFKAAAIVAIILTLGNAMQVALNQPDPNTNIADGTQVEEMKKGESVAIADTMRQDSMKITEAPFIK
jgi:hypothetical protein